MAVAGMTLFNVDGGFVEAVVRGMRSGFLSDEEYHHLTQCKDMEDIKLNLQETDYGNLLSAEASPVLPKRLEAKCTEKWVEEFQYLRSCASEPLSTFLDYITYEYMIENILRLLKGTMGADSVDPAALIAQSHPLGKFKEATMKSICAFDNTPRGYQELYSTVLIDTPVGPYFQQYLQDQIKKKTLDGAGEVRNILEEVPLSTLENMVMKLYLEDFYAFCMKLGGATAEVMGDILKERADAISISITLNSFNTFYNEPSHRSSSRKALYPSFGVLYPDGTDALSKVEDEGGLGRALAPYPEYRALWAAADVLEGEEKELDTPFFVRQVKILELAFEAGQFQYGIFYAYVKLKEREVKNVVWIADMILQRRGADASKYIPIFSKMSPWRRK